MTVRNKQAGFTLLEILVATAIFSFIAVISYSSLSDALLARERTESFNQQLADLQLAVQIIDKDFRQIINRPIKDPNGSNIQRPAISLGSNENAIEFSHSGWPNPLFSNRSELQRVAYKLEENTLIRQYWQHLDRSGSAEGVSTTLLKNINELKIQVLDKDNQWQTYWPKSSSHSSEHPKAVELILVSEQWGEIRRVYEVL